MKNSLRWRIVGIGMVLGLGMGYGLGKSGQISPPSFSSAAYAEEAAPTKPMSKEPTLNFSLIRVPHHPELQFERAKVPGGWMLLVRRLNSNGVDAFTFYPDPQHEWEGESIDEKAELSASREAAEERPPRLVPPPFKPAAAAAKAMELYDTNKDGKISREELDKAPGLKAALKVIGTDQDKGITADQISMRLQRWLDSRIGRTSLSCMVLHNGQPLAGATVKFVPEKFLGESIPEAAVGTTNQTGMAMLSVPNAPGADLPPGLPPGMYRVEITKKGENIPAKYNTETALGQEVSLDNIDLQMGIKFNLKY